MSLPLPGQAGSNAPAGPDWMVRKLRELEQQVGQLRGQLSALQTSASVVIGVTVAGSTLTVTFADGSTSTATLP